MTVEISKPIVGWDIGGANVKAAAVAANRERGAQASVASMPFEIWRDKHRLAEVLQRVYDCLSLAGPPQAMALTMTAELSDAFLNKREGVLFVLESMGTVFADPPCYALSLRGDFEPLIDARRHPLDFAATNWLATARWISRHFRDCLVVDVGSTTTDIIPVLNGCEQAAGRTDMERLSSGELVFTGVLRTNLCAIVQVVPVRGQPCRVASEYFAVSGDVHLVLGHISKGEYTCATPDGLEPTVDSARRRIARIVCADTEMLQAAEIDGIARHVYGQQVRQIRAGMEQVLRRFPRSLPVIPLGTGAFLGSSAAREMDLKVLGVESRLRREESAVFPCIAAAALLSEQLKDRAQ